MIEILVLIIISMLVGGIIVKHDGHMTGLAMVLGGIALWAIMWLVNH